MIISQDVLGWIINNSDWIIIFIIIISFSVYCSNYYSSKNVFDPQPKFRIFIAFVLGIISVIPTIFLSTLILMYVDESLSSVVVAPIAEEISKGILVILLSRRENFQGPLDGLIYGAMVGTGFAFTENIFYAINALDRGGLFAGVFVASVRSVLQIIGHPLYTGIFGFGVGGAQVGFANFSISKLPQAIILHAIWNSIVVFGLIISIIVVVGSIMILKYEVRKAINLDMRARIRGYY